MFQKLLDFVDWFIPDQIGESDLDRLMARTFVALHFIGPLMGHSVTYFLARTTAVSTWQFWVTEALVVSFFAIPLILRVAGNLVTPAMLSAQMLVCLSLFGSFFFGGISSPFLPWFLIAMGLGFFFLADKVAYILAGVGTQLALFFTARALLGDFPDILTQESLKFANLLSICAALVYMTILSLYYEKVMRNSAQAELETDAQRMKLQSLREAMEAAELASKRKSIFLAKMSHELRTPLNAVIGYTEMLRETYEDKGSDERKMSDLDRISAAARHLLALVDDVIDLSSIEANRLEVLAKPIRLTSLVDDVVATAAPLVKRRENRLIVDMPEDLGVLQLDALKLRQSVLNLLSNAAKFTTKGVVMLSVNCIRNDDDGSEVLRIEVADNGIGMTRDGLSRLFSDFSQAENDTSEKFGGTGLGLALTRRFCTMMGGSIAVSSERGIGSTFTIKLPMTRGQPAEQPQDLAA